VADRIGPVRVALGAAVLLAVSYQLMYHSLLDAGASWSSPSLCALWWFGVGHGCGWLYNSTMFCNARNFCDLTRAFVLGTLALAFGMASPIWATFLHSCVGGTVVEVMQGGYECTGGFINGDVKAYMAFMSIATPVLTSFGAILSSQLTPEEVEQDEQASIRLRWWESRMKLWWRGKDGTSSSSRCY